LVVTNAQPFYNNIEETDISTQRVNSDEQVAKTNIKLCKRIDKIKNRSSQALKQSTSE